MLSYSGNYSPLAVGRSVGITCALSWSGWPDLNRRPLRPEAKLRHGLPGPQRAWPAADRPWTSADVRRWPWRLSTHFVTQSPYVRGGRRLSADRLARSRGATAREAAGPSGTNTILGLVGACIAVTVAVGDTVKQLRRRRSCPRVRAEPVMASGCTVRPADGRL
jgi:hypothetical protein